MNLLLFWLATTVGSFGIKTASVLGMVKFVADTGHKLNMEKVQ